MPHKTTADEYFAQAHAIHGLRFDYTDSVFVNLSSPITVRCVAHDERFSVNARNHLWGRKAAGSSQSFGCPACAKTNRHSGMLARSTPRRASVTTESFIARCKEIYGDKFSYENVVYVSAGTKVSITCPQHGDFLRTPVDFAYKKRGCPACKKDKVKKEKLSQVIAKFTKAHGQRYDYSLVQSFENGDSKVTIICRIHGPFKQSVFRHYEGRGCRACSFISTATKNTHTTESYVQKAKSIHKDKFDYSKTIYSSSKEDITVICPDHGEQTTSAIYHLSKHGCHECAVANMPKGSRQSWISSRWLEDLAVANHEYSLPHLHVITDGYDESTNTVYEFYGCFFHGCLTCFEPKKMNTKLSLTMKELHEKTLARENRIKAAGYNVVSIWECSYRKQRQANGLPVKPSQSKA